MNKTAIKDYAIWARTKLIEDTKYKAGLIGISERGIEEPLPQSTLDLQFFDIGMNDPVQIGAQEIRQRNELVEKLESKEKESDFETAFDYIIEEVAYTWFNRIIAVRFMEVNEYLPSNIRMLSSEDSSKQEPDMVTRPFNTDLDFSESEKQKIIKLKSENKDDELFRLLFIKQCNKFNGILPEIFEKTSDYTELLFNISWTDQEGVVGKLIKNIPEEDFKETVEIIGWMYQYYNTEPKDETFKLLKKNIKISKERIPAATQLFTPDWIVKYMVENSLGRLWIEGHEDSDLEQNWKYYLKEAEQEPEVQEELKKIRKEYRKLKPEDIRFIDPCMGSGHILVYAFDLLMQIYESQGWNRVDAAASIVENNLYGIDIDDRAYQLAYFGVMMKGRQYDRRFFDRDIKNNIVSITESNGLEQIKGETGQITFEEAHKETANYLIEVFQDAKEYGSILNIEERNYEGLENYLLEIDEKGSLDLITYSKINPLKEKLPVIIKQAKIMSQKYDVVVTNPPYMGTRGRSSNAVKYIGDNFPISKADIFSVFIEKCFSWLIPNGYSSIVTPESWMFISSYEKLRGVLLEQYMFTSLIHLGFGAFECGFGTVILSIGAHKSSNHKCKYINLSDIENKELGYENCDTKTTYIKDQNAFLEIPSHPIAYWVTNRVISIFCNFDKISDYGNTRQGMATSDNKRFLRNWYEVIKSKIEFNNMGTSKKKWFPYNKGGGFRKWYGTACEIINWENDGQEVKEYAASLYGSYTRTIKNINDYFMESLAWPYISSNARFGARYQPRGFIFDVAGSSFFTKSNNIYYFCGLLSSKVAISFMRIINPTMNYQVGDVARIPVIISIKSKKQDIDKMVKTNIERAKTDWDAFETSWDFKKHPLL